VEGAEGAAVVEAARDRRGPRLQVEQRRQELLLQALLPRAGQQLLEPADHPPVARIREKTVPAAPSQGGAAKEPGLLSNPPVQQSLARRQAGDHLLPILKAAPALCGLPRAKPALPEVAMARLAGDSDAGGAEAEEPVAQMLPNLAEAAAGAAVAQRRAETPLPHLRIRLKGRAISRAREPREGALP
jgi:hypothetical protein